MVVWESDENSCQLACQLPLNESVWTEKSCSFDRILLDQCLCCTLVCPLRHTRVLNHGNKCQYILKATVALISSDVSIHVFFLCKCKNIDLTQIAEWTKMDLPFVETM